MRISDWSSDVCSSDLRSRRSQRGYCDGDHTREDMFRRIKKKYRVFAATPRRAARDAAGRWRFLRIAGGPSRSEAHTSELPSLMRIPYAVFRLKTNTTAPQRQTPN